MPTMRCQVVLPFFTNLPSDAITNTFHFDPLTPLDLAATAAIVNPHLATFYSQIYNSTFGIGDYTEPTQMTFNWYDLQAPPPRVPLVFVPDTPMTQKTTVIPTEVACVLSMQAPQVSGEPQARRRGRIYLGALTNDWFASSTAAIFPIFSTAAVNHVTAAATLLANEVLGDGVRWSVWSPTDEASALVTNGWVDNSPDTQRRRSVDATARALWTGGGS